MKGNLCERQHRKYFQFQSITQNVFTCRCGRVMTTERSNNIFIPETSSSPSDKLFLLRAAAAAATGCGARDHSVHAAAVVGEALRPTAAPRSSPSTFTSPSSSLSQVFRSRRCDAAEVLVAPKSSPKIRSIVNIISTSERASRHTRKLIPQRGDLCDDGVYTCVVETAKLLVSIAVRPLYRRSERSARQRSKRLS